MADLVLVVEDDPDVRTALTRALSFEGYEVATASDGGRALEMVLNDPPSVIVLDVMMPFVDGLETCRRLRARGDETPILMLTAKNQPDDVVYGLKLGADDYVTKPFRVSELVARVEALLRHPGFTLRNPNKVRAVLGVFAMSNPTAFHAADGSGYRLLADQVIELDALNPQVAARIVGAFNPWTRHDAARRALMKAQLQRIASAPGLSGDVAEIVENALGMERLGAA